MQKLEKEYKINKQTFNCVKRSEMVYWAESDTGYHFEVFLIKDNPEKEMFDKKYPRRESVPCNEEWGILGWSFCSYDKAEKCYNKLVSKYG